MRVVSFNVNGIRARLHQLQAVVEQHSPEIIGLQEIKVQDQDFPLEAVQQLGYHTEHFGQKGHYGVALLSKTPPQFVQKGFPGTDHSQQRRLLHATYTTSKGALHVLNGYFPQGENRAHPVKFVNKREFYADLNAYLHAQFKPSDNVIVLGDMNVALEDSDVGIAPENARRWLRDGKCAFLPEERAWLDDLKAWGLLDTFKENDPTQIGVYSWFDYRSGGFQRDPKRGLRIDYVLSSKPLIERLTEAGIDYQIRASEKPSDHCPIWADFDI